jgi:enamine deaminase RidA (YjgF/YER057c/UK114 family)
VVEVNGPHRVVYLAGQTGVDANGKVAQGFRAQAVQVMENIKTALASVGGDFDHVVKLTSYLTDIEANADVFRELRASYFPNKAAASVHLAADIAPRQFVLSARSGKQSRSWPRGRSHKGVAGVGLGHPVPEARPSRKKASAPSRGKARGAC